MSGLLSYFHRAALLAFAIPAGRLSVMMKLHIRLATMGDAAQLLVWRNDPITRANSHTTDPVSLEDHVAWLHRMIERRESLYIAMQDDEAIGTARLTRDDPPMMSVTVAPQWRGTGMSGYMVQAVLDLPNTPPVVRADVKTDNIASQRMLRGRGFVVIAQHEGYDTWECSGHRRYPLGKR